MAIAWLSPVSIAGSLALGAIFLSGMTLSPSRRASHPVALSRSADCTAAISVGPRAWGAFVESLPVGKFHGIGPATSAKMNALGLHTGLDIRNQSIEFMQANFGKPGSHYYWISRGVDNREVRADRVRKSIGAENTFSHDLTEFEDMPNWST